MQIASVAYAAVTPIRRVAPTASGAQTASATPLSTLGGLASVILDGTGKYSGSDKLHAYNTSFRLSVTGQYRDVGPDGANLLNQIAGSGTAQQVESHRASYADAMMAAIQKAGASGVSRSAALGAAALKHFDSLPDPDQQALFSSINAPDRTGATPFADLVDWRDQMSAMAGLPRPPADTVTLSPYAQTLMGESKPAAPGPPVYSAGSVANIKV